jgi:hypothetical protein
MRTQKITYILAALAVLSAVPLSASALQVRFCTPVCEGTGADPTPSVFNGGTPVTDANGVTTNSAVIVATHTNGATSFTITATVTSQQSASLQKITFNPTSITVNAGSPCSTANPCRLEVMATSDELDFPTPKPSGGYPAGAYMVGSFTGFQAASPNGDTISATSEASGIRLVSADTTGGVVVEPISTDVVNATPGTGPANVGTSLPSSCTGTTGCRFVASALRKAFATQINETVQQQCDVEQPTCLTRLRTRLNIEFKTPGNRVTLPYDWATANNDPQRPEVNPTEVLLASTLTSASAFEVNSLAVGPHHFTMKANLGLGADATIDPVTEEVYARVGTFSLTILPGSFKRQQDGRVFAFHGKVEGRQVNATFARDRRNPALWEVVLAVHGVEVTGLPQPPLQIPVEIGVGGDAGRDVVTARFLGQGASK